MKKSLLFVTLVASLGLVACNKSTKTTTASNDLPAPTPAATDTAVTPAPDSAASRIGADLKDAANTAGNAIAGTARTMEWKLTASDINADLAAGRDIVRTREAAAGAPTGTTDRSVLKSAVQGRIAADSELSALKLDVNPKSNGEIQLEGKAQTADQVGKAIALALDTDGVTKVTSKIKLDKDAVKN